MKALDIMTPDPACCGPSDTVQRAAQLMAQNDCGAIPIVENGESQRLIAVVTDRDLACRCLADGKGPESSISDVMSGDPSFVGPDVDVREVERIMTARQVRRVPVVDEAGRCIGIIAQADLARAAGGRGVSRRDVARVVERVSEPAPTSRREKSTSPRPEAR